MRRSRKRFVTRLACGCACLLIQSGCWSFRVGPGSFEFPAAPAEDPHVQEALLRVNEAGIPWSNGEFSDAIEEQLRERQIFAVLHHRIEPGVLPAITVEVVGLGELDEAVLWAILASTATGYLLFAPAPFLPYFQDYEAGFEVRVLRKDDVLGTFEVKETATVVSAIFASPRDYLPAARSKLIEVLSKEVASGVEDILSEVDTPPT